MASTDAFSETPRYSTDTGRGARLRVLLVHANPFQRVLPVPPYGLERIKTAAADTDAEIEILDPYLLSETPHELATEVVRRMRPSIVGISLRIVDDSVVIERLDAPASEPTDITWFLPEIRALRETLRAAAPEALTILGGATFSYLPHEALEYLDVEWGVVGAGEAAFREVLLRRAAGRPIDDVPGLLRRGESQPIEGLVAFPSRPTVRDPLYAPTSCFPVRTRIGCGMKCSYCLTAALHGRHAIDGPDAVLDEIEAVVSHARRHGLGPAPLFFADDEFNLPGEDHATAILQGLVDRGLDRHVQWRAYFNPVPFSPRLAALIARTNGHASITVDTASERVMARNRKPFRLKHLEATLTRLRAEKVSNDLTFLFGLPGETGETIEETVGFLRRLPSDVRAGYGVGARVYPHTPLANEARAHPEHLVGADDPSFLAPVVFCASSPPRPLAVNLTRALRGVSNVSQSRGGYGDGTPLPALAYRAALDPDGADDWEEVLELATAPRPGRGAHEALGNVSLAALWHGRYDLAASAMRRIADGAEPHPDDARIRVLATAAACGPLQRITDPALAFQAQRTLGVSRLALSLSAAAKPW